MRHRLRHSGSGEASCDRTSVLLNTHIADHLPKYKVAVIGRLESISRGRSLLTAAAVFALASGTALPAIAQTGGDMSGIWEIVASHSGKCLDVSGGSYDNSAAIIQSSCHGGDNQRWSVEDVGGGYYRLVARHSGKAIDIRWGLMTDAAAAVQYSPTGSENQQWAIQPVGNGYYRLVARHSGKALDVAGASTQDGARVVQYSLHGGSNQQWLLRGASGGTSSPPPTTSASSGDSTGVFEIVASHSGKCLDVSGASYNNSAAIIQSSCHGGDNQRWSVEDVGGGYYRLLALHSGKALDISRGLVTDAAAAIQYTPTGAENQQWAIQSVGNGYYQLVARHSGKALDVAAASTQDGARVVQYSQTSGANQQWLLRAASGGAASPPPSGPSPPATSPSSGDSTGVFEIVASHSGKCLDVSGGSYDNSAAIIQSSCHGGDNQRWSVEALGNGYYHVVARHSGKAIDIRWGLMTDSAAAVQYTPTGSENQQWAVQSAGNGYYRMVARHSGKALDVAGASTHDGARVVQYSLHSGSNQQWLLRAVSGGTSSIAFAPAPQPAPSSNTPPAVALTSPWAGQSFNAPASVTLSATASDGDGSVVRVDFYAGGTYVGSKSSAPYSVSWTNVPAGTYSLAAVAYDDAGATTVSGTTSISVVGGQIPRLAVFVPSSNHSTAIERYVVDFYYSGADPSQSNAISSVDIGKPAVVNGECQADVSEATLWLGSGSYIATVTAIGPGGSARSAPASFWIP